MKNFKRILSVLLVCVMIVPMCAINTGAKGLASYLWTPVACKYSSRTNQIITVDENGTKVPKTAGFTFEENENGGISVHTPTYKEFGGVYGVSAVTSPNKTTLDNLTIVINPDEFDFSRDAKASASNHISILWSEDEPKDIMDMNDATGPATNGLRNLIPTNADNVTGVPASAVDASKHNGKSLFIDIHNAYDEYTGTKVASSVYIIYYDGYYINHNDGAPGYRWAFTGRNVSESPLGDSSGVQAHYERIDMTYGLVVSVKPHDTYGYVVNINGKDYCDPMKVGFFPDANVDGTSHGMFSNDDMQAKTEAWKKTMTYNRTPIDLNALKGSEGYLTIGAVSNDDQAFPEHRCDYTISYINAVPAAKWEGEYMDPHHEHSYTSIETIDPDCVNVGKEVFQCSCGAVYSDDIPAKGHNLNKINSESYDPTCLTNGLEVNECKRCDYREENVLPMLGHDLDDWYVSTAATSEADGVKTRECTRCDYNETKSYKFTNKDLLLEDWEITSENLGFTNLVANNYITEYSVENEIVDAEYTEDGGLFVKDISAMTGKNWTYKGVTKAASKHKIALNNFAIDVTPVANETYGNYPETISFSFSNIYGKYNFAGEHSTGSEVDSTAFHGVPSEEFYRAGTYYESPSEGEYSVIFTLLEYATVNGQPWVGSKEDDGYYDAIQWSVISNGNYWDGKVIGLMDPIKQGDTISLYTLHYAWEDTQLVWLMLGDEEIITLDSCSSSQLQDQDYYFTVSAYSPQYDAVIEGQNYPDSGASTSFVIDSILYDNVENFKGWDDPHTCSDIFDDMSDISVGYDKDDTKFAKWITVKAPTCVDDGLKVIDCPYCDGYAAEEILPALGGEHNYGDYISNGDATCTENGTATATCSICGVTDTKVEEDSALGHTEGEWKVTVEAKLGVEGEETLYCEVCNAVLDTRKTAALSFIDVKEGAWYYNAAYYCAGKGYITGNDKNEFMPNANLTREQFVVILARVAGADLSQYTTTNFTDVKAGSWYGPSVIWAATEGVVKGVGDGSKFGVGQAMTREQIATMFFRYAELTGEDMTGKADLSVYTDVAKISSWAKDACAWAVDAEIIKSTSTAKLVFSPKMTVTRAQAAQIFMNYDNIA